MIYLFWTLCGFVLYTTLRLSFTFLGVPWTWESYLIGLAAYLILTFVGFFLLRRAEKKNTEKKKINEFCEQFLFGKSPRFRFTYERELELFKAIAYDLMNGLNVSSVLIEFVPFCDRLPSEEPVIVTFEPFGNSKRLNWIKRFFGKRRK